MTYQYKREPLSIEEADRLLARRGFKVSGGFRVRSVDS